MSEETQNVLNKEIITAAKKLQELCYTMEYCEDCPLGKVGCIEHIPMEWDVDEVKNMSKEGKITATNYIKQKTLEAHVQWFAELDYDDAMMIMTSKIMYEAKHKGKTYRDICEELEDACYAEEELKG